MPRPTCCDWASMPSTAGSSCPPRSASPRAPGSPPPTWAPRATSRSQPATPTCWSSTPRPSWSQRFVPGLLDGRFLGTMALSEPQAGSNLADITTRAVPQDDGTYRVFGQKMWISAGDHELTDNIVHLVLAKIPGGPAGTRGISLLLVPKVLVAEDGTLGERNDVVLAGINHKMGWRGTVNTVPSFGVRRLHPRRGGGRGRLPRGRAPPRSVLHVHDDERGPHRRRPGRRRPGLHRLPQVARLRPVTAAGPRPWPPAPRTRRSP